MIYILFAAYNEAAVLPSLLEHIKESKGKYFDDCRIIAYNDGSHDKTLEILQSYKEALNINVISSDKNNGLGYGISILLKEVVKLSKNTDDIAVLMDADDTHELSAIPKMVQSIKVGSDVVIASRFCTGSKIFGVPLHRKLLSYAASIYLSRILRLKNVKDYTCGYRAYKIPILKKIYNVFQDKLITETGFSCQLELLVKLARFNANMAEIPFELRYDRKINDSKMKIIKTILQTINLSIKLLSNIKS